MFTVILLIGSGWSFVKSYLTKHEKAIILTVLVLQVFDNIAILILSRERQGQRFYSTWNAVMHLIDIVCCCAILLPLVWQVNALEKSLERHENEVQEEHDESQPLETNGATNYNSARSPSEEAEKNQILSKLRLFRSFYLLVVAYIYLTRVVVYLFTTALDYRHLWVQHMLVELVTLTFFVIIGLKFRPMEANPYFAVYQEKTEAEEYEVELQPTIMDRVKDAKFS
jgi:NADH:ubiquinone oxidoreductase subunit 3 (subunit A)